MLQGSHRRIRHIAIATVAILAPLVAFGGPPATAQTKPKVMESGVARPASAIYIGNSFFY
jgi:hypothetical protein